MKIRGPIAVIGFAVVAVSPGSSPAQSSNAQPPAAAVGVLVPTPRSSIVPPAPVYDRKGRRDPFLPIELVQSENKAPLVASARLKGIVRGSPPRVLLEMQDGMGYILKAGDVLADGRLIEIGRDSVVFTVPPRRGSIPERIVLRLPED
jgi:hypothetical protein